MKPGESSSSTPPAQERPSHPFEELLQQEDQALGFADQAKYFVRASSSTGEPFVKSTSRDTFGLAFSGGGIRSATFNLGLLQALNAKGILKHVHYLSTVSGGGYTGGFWVAWLKNFGAKQRKLFPSDTAAGSSPASGPEAPEIRHLREFSRFLMPRVGFLKEEMWAGIVAILSGLIPALLLAGGFLAIVILAWAGLANLFLQPVAIDPSTPSYLLVGCMSAILAAFVLRTSETRWEECDKAEPSRMGHRAYNVLLGVALLAVVLGWVYLAPAYYSALGTDSRAAFFPELPAQPGGQLQPNYRMLAPPIVWVAASLAILPIRIVLLRRKESESFIPEVAATDRIVMRLLGLSLVWLLLVFIWELAAYALLLREAVAQTGAAALTSTALFVWARKWLGKEPSRARAEGLWSKLKPILPQIFANIAVLLMASLVAYLLMRVGPRSFPACMLWTLGALACFFVGLLLFHPTKIGLHDFYRSRICRAFLGAAHPDDAGRAENNRMTTEREKDDVNLADEKLWNGPFRPLHLVCCTANNLSADALSTLYRGARSATVSRHGIAIAGRRVKMSPIWLSSALTASAAAFNSTMGSISMRLGPAVTFLLTALNLRLGLWVPNPACPGKKRRVPGVFFMKELFGLTDCDADPFVHLSDGGHFENLALYELVRRHCRYIIVSDCGADPDNKFDDFGNAVRRIREDFGAEIDIDLTPLIPDEKGISRQHLAVGAIHYDGELGTDKGFLIYLKPVLTGDEPSDVVQYSGRNPEFPHESTGDQFYDEAQWEAYRRLGEHAGNRAFSFFDDPAEHKDRPEYLFNTARMEWYPPMPHQDVNFLSLTDRCSRLEGEIRDRAPDWLRAEFFPEARLVCNGVGNATSGTSKPRTAEDEERALYYLLQVAQVMEDTWLACHLDEHWNHPLNQGWMNYMQRWASTPSFRRWWPILKPIYGPSFQRFADEHLNLDSAELGIRCEIIVFLPSDEGLDRALKEELRRRAPTRNGFTEELTGGLACRRWCDSVGRDTNAPWDFPGQVAFAYYLRWPASSGAQPLQIAFALVTFHQVESRQAMVQWRMEDFFVPPGFWGSGTGGRFLRALLGLLENLPASEVKVLLPDSTHLDGSGTGRRREWCDLVTFYRGSGFVPSERQENERGAALIRPLNGNRRQVNPSGEKIGI